MVDFISCCLFLKLELKGIEIMGNVKSNNELLAEKDKEIEELKAKIKKIEDFESLKYQVNEKDDISFVSLSIPKLILQTGKLGDTEPEIFEEFGETKLIDYKTANEIVKRNMKFIKNGLIWIGDEFFLERENLSKLFKGIKNREELEALATTKNRDYFEKEFSSLVKGQKQTVAELIQMQYEKGKHNSVIVDSANNILSKEEGRIVDLIGEVERYKTLMKPTVTVR